ADLLKSAPGDLEARTALLAWLKDVEVKAGTLSPDQAVALRGLANAVMLGEFGRAQAIIDGKPVFFARFLGEKVAAFKSWTGFENNQIKVHQEGGWIVLPDGYAEPAPVLPGTDPTPALPQGAAVIRAGEFHSSKAPAPAPQLAGEIKIGSARALEL